MSDPPKNLSESGAPTLELLVQIRAEMWRKKLSTPQLASRMQVPNRTLNNWLNSQTLMHSHASKIAEALGVPISVLASRAEHAERTAA